VKHKHKVIEVANEEVEGREQNNLIKKRVRIQQTKPEN
jgi:hypothetical protein